jgi:type VI protein secretion system component VasK
MSSKSIEDLKEKYLAFLESVRNHKEVTPSDSVIDNLDLHFRDLIEDEELKEVLPEVDAILEYSFGSAIRSKPLRECLKRLNDEDLKKINASSISLIEQTLDEDICFNYERKSGQALELSLAIQQEIQSRI